MLFQIETKAGWPRSEGEGRRSVNDGHTAVKAPPREEYPTFRIVTGGEGSITQWVHGEFIVISEAIHSHFTHQAHGKHF